MDWLSRYNYEMNRDKEIPGMCITINMIESYADIPNCMTKVEIGEASLEVKHLSAYAEHVLCGWLSTQTEVQKELQCYWSFRV